MGTEASFRDDLSQRVAEADRRMHHVLDTFDDYIDKAGLNREVLPASRPGAVDVPAPVTRLNLAARTSGP